MNNVQLELEKYTAKPLTECSAKEVYVALVAFVNDRLLDKQSVQSKKKVYYLSAEFLIGKLLSNNLINLGLYDEVRSVLSQNGHDITTIEEILEQLDPEPSLGNGGLGRLAACFLDSMATLGISGDGIGLNYHMGLFRQKFNDNLQQEFPDYWMPDDHWLIPTSTSFAVTYKDFTLHSCMYDIAVSGYHGQTNRLHLFDLDSVDESIVKRGIKFDKEDIKRNLTLFLYPDDSDKAGELLRIYQQYFLVSNGAQLILEECHARGCNYYDLPDYAAIQINDTHPTLVIPELIRLLCEKGLSMDESISVVEKCCSYTNHTILAEALETWPISYLEEVVPHLLPIIKELDARIKEKYRKRSIQIIDSKKRVHMAHIDIHYGYRVNGVAKLHTDILKQTELRDFYKLYPEKFHNKTNGITFRRWLLHTNPSLSAYLDQLIGEDYKTDATKLLSLMDHMEDETVLTQLSSIKQTNKIRLKDHLARTCGITLNENSIFDIQVKRLHEYKRQQLNALYIIHKYLEIKRGQRPTTPITLLFGAKAAPAYTIAKDIIHLILCLQEIILHDPEVSPYLTVVMVENYNVTQAELLIPACDISEQISLASKEASGTGNMKFMLNGAVTLGTMDGANVEIAQLVGEDNIYIFGENSKDVIAHYKKKDYLPKAYYNSIPALKEAVDFITSEEMLRVGKKRNLTRLRRELLSKDWFMTFLDFTSYCEAKEKAYHDYEDSLLWSKKMLSNIAHAGYFSSDRTIAEYNKDVWHV